MHCQGPFAQAGVGEQLEDRGFRAEQSWLPRKARVAISAASKDQGTWNHTQVLRWQTQHGAYSSLVSSVSPRFLLRNVD